MELSSVSRCVTTTRALNHKHTIINPDNFTMFSQKSIFRCLPQATLPTNANSAVRHRKRRHTHTHTNNIKTKENVHDAGRGSPISEAPPESRLVAVGRGGCWRRGLVDSLLTNFLLIVHHGSRSNAPRDGAARGGNPSVRVRGRFRRKDSSIHHGCNNLIITRLTC